MHIHLMMSQNQLETGEVLSIRYYSDSDEDLVLGALSEPHTRKMLEYTGNPSKSDIDVGFWNIILVAELVYGEKGAVGFAKISGGKKNGYNNIDWIYVMPSYRGFGYGKELLKKAVNEASMNWRSFGCTCITVDGNERMEQILSSCGFEQCGEIDNFIWNNGSFTKEKHWVLSYE